MCKDIPWKTLSEAYAFVGNSLLRPMTMTSPVGLDPAFWKAFPVFDEAPWPGPWKPAHAMPKEPRSAPRAGEDGPQRVSVEYTRLFVGPPSPAAPPWETMYRGKDVTVGFGQPTFEMRELLRAAGLEVRNANNQYEDHMGIELLYLSELCRREATGESATEVGGHRRIRRAASAVVDRAVSRSRVRSGARRLLRGFAPGGATGSRAPCEAPRALAVGLV